MQNKALIFIHLFSDKYLEYILCVVREQETLKDILDPNDVVNSVDTGKDRIFGDQYDNKIHW